MSRVVEFSEDGGPEVLKFRNVDVPEPGPGQVRIRVKAIGLNRAESMWRRNQYIEPVVDRVFPFDKIVDAHRYLEKSEQIGKIVVTI